jgi:hypothetical protein
LADLHFTSLHCKQGRRDLGAASNDLTQTIFKILARHRKKQRLLVRGKACLAHWFVLSRLGMTLGLLRACVSQTVYKRLHDIKTLLSNEKKVQDLLNEGLLAYRFSCAGLSFTHLLLVAVRVYSCRRFPVGRVCAPRVHAVRAK